MARTSRTPILTWLLLGAAGLGVLGCGDTGGSSAGEGSPTTAAASGDADLKGRVLVDGSSTVAPISQRVSEAFRAVAPGVEVPVGEAGTGSGMKKFIAGEIDVCGASRPIKPEEMAKAKAAGLEFIELPVAFDGLSIIVNKKNTWVNSITTEELKKIWAPSSKVKTWNEVNSAWPNKPITLYGPATNHGTYEYFAEAIVKDKSKATRQDYQQNQEYNALVAGVAADPNALGYVGFAYFEANSDSLKLIPVDSGKGPIAPSKESIENGTYEPLARPLFIYVSQKAVQGKPAVKRFVEYFLDNAKTLVPDAKYIALPDELIAASRGRLDGLKTGTVFSPDSEGMSLKDVLAKEKGA